MRDANLEATIWSFFTSAKFFEAAADDCEETMKWFGRLAVSKNAANFGRNNQIFDKFKKIASDFRRGAEIARLGDYQLVWQTARGIRGDVRGMIEQPLHSWMTEAEYKEFEDIRIGGLRMYAGRISSALNNAMMGSESFFNLDPNYKMKDYDSGYPDDTIVKWYNDYVDYSKKSGVLEFPSLVPEYEMNRLVSCQTGDEVPWTGVWYPATGLERHSLTFGIKGSRMQPVYRVLKTTEELRTESNMFPYPETLALETVWHPFIPSARQVETDNELRAKAGESCPKTGVWEAMDAGAARQRTYQVGETMGNLGSAYGITVWRWSADH